VLNAVTDIYDEHTEIFNNPAAIELQANDRFNYLFSHWTINHHTLSPDNLSELVNFWFIESDTVTAHFIEDQTGVYFPVSFSPNGDGLNDYFSLFSTYQIKSCKIMIFNRWGEMIFSSEDTGFRWDGTWQGRICPQGVYAYSFFYTLQGTENKLSIYGAVTIVK
jgi:gliding motility-associated-like protein